MKEILISNLSKKYGDIKALDSINLEIKEGITGLLGHNGAGKSTLLNILTRIIKQDEGFVKYNGTDINELGLKYNDLISYMPQQLSINLEMSVYGFFKYMKAMKKVKNCDLDEIINLVNLKEHKDKKIKNLSGGMKQRLLIGQALINNPEILFLDEPTAGLDPFERKNLRNIISDLSEDRIVVIATHVISDLEYIANDLIFLKNGKLVDQGSQEYFSKIINVYESYLSENELLKMDEDILIVNKIRTDKGVNIRFISKKEFENKVQTNLDDIYLGILKWLEKNSRD